MKSHRTIWNIAAAALGLALIAFALREALAVRERTAETRLSLDRRDRLTEEMMSLLEVDSRMRRPGTRRLVEAVSAYAANPAIASAEAFYALGLRRYYGEEDFAGAEEAYLRARDMRPDWSRPRNGLGILWFATGEEERGLASFGEALALEPTWSRPHSDMAILYRLAGRMEEAVREVEAALEIEPQDPVNHFNYGVILDLLGRHMEARVRYERALELSPGLPPALYNLACSYAREGHLEMALAYLMDSIDLDEAFREEAVYDPDFDKIRDRPEFNSIVKRSKV